MAKIFSNQIEYDKAVLVGVGVNETIDEQSLEELSSLCKTCNILTVAIVVQNRKDVDVTYYVGKGKVDEIKAAIQQNEATVVVFDVELSGSKVRNLEAVLGVPVLDRSKVILDIFAQRAQSAEGKLQVELAQLKYNLPRLIGSSGVMAKMKSAVGMRGPGEKKLELDKRKIRDEISLLEGRLAKLKETRVLAKKQSVKSGKPRVCLVGYTNSGKSTLLNTIAKSDALAADKLFATLDPKTANVFIANDTGGVQILLTDTVGFINKLPHEFIKAFESTLDEVRYADLLLHVVDISNADYPQQIAVVNEVLEKIDSDNIPTLMVYNKIDKVQMGAGMGGCAISAKNNIGIDLLKTKIVSMLNL